MLQGSRYLPSGCSMASIAAVEKTTEYGDINGLVKRERLPSPEAMDTNNNNNRGDMGELLSSSDTNASAANSRFYSSSDALQQQNQTRTAPGGTRNARILSMQQQQGQSTPGGQACSSAGGRQASAELPGGRRRSADILRSLISPEFPSQTGTPTSLSQLIPNLSSAFSLEGNEFATPMGSGHLSPQTTDRQNRKRALSISPLSSSSLDLNSLIRTSPNSLVNYITTSRGSSAGSFGHLSPSLFNSMHPQSHGRPIQISLRSSNYPITNITPSGSRSFVNQQQSNEFAVGENGIQVKKELELSPPCGVLDRDVTKMEDIHDSFFDSCNVNIKVEPGMTFIPPPLIPMGLETVQEEPGGMLASEEEELMYSDPTDYSSMMIGNDCEYETKLGIIDSISDADKQKRIYYSYPSVEEPHNNQCKWAECRMQCEDLDSLVQHVNGDHIYRDSKKEFVCHWTGCVRERKPFKAQYMLLVHMRRHTGEKPHKCTYEGCFKAYSRLENLKTHLRSHTGERPYICKYEGCGKAFSNASDCAKHMNRTHSDEKPYACPNPGCTKRYTDPSSRRKHMKNCQVNKKARKDNSDAMSGADEESCAETAVTAATPKPAGNNKKATKPRKTEKRKSSTSNPTAKGLSGDHGYGSGGSQAGYVSGGSQAGYVSGGSQGGHASQMGYNSSGYDDSDYSGQLQEEEISRILEAQRLSDPAEIGGMANGHMTRDGHVAAYHFQSPPSGQYMPQPPSLIPTTTSQQTLQGDPNNAHHGGGGEFIPPMMRSRQTRTPSSGYSSFRSMEKSPDDIDSASIISNGIRSNTMGTASQSTFSSGSSRVSSPCSTSDRAVSMFPHVLGVGHRGEVAGAASYPQQKHMHSLRNSCPQPLQPQHHHHQRSQPEHHGYHMRNHSDEILSTSSRTWTCSSQSSHYSAYSGTGSELSDDLLDSLPTTARRDSFSKSTPLPLPESMQHGDRAGMGMEYGNGEHRMGFQHQNGYMDHSSSTMPLRHYDNSDGYSSSASQQHQLFSQDNSHLSGDGFISMMLSSPSSNSIMSPGNNNMVLGTMETFTQALSEETQYYESVYQVTSQVKSM